MRDDPNPVKNPSNPIQAEMFCTKGFSKIAPALPITWRKETRVKEKKKMMLRPRPIARNTGVAELGALNRSFGALLGRTERS